MSIQTVKTRKMLLKPSLILFVQFQNVIMENQIHGKRCNLRYATKFNEMNSSWIKANEHVTRERDETRGRRHFIYISED